MAQGFGSRRDFLRLLEHRGEPRSMEAQQAGTLRVEAEKAKATLQQTISGSMSTSAPAGVTKEHKLILQKPTDRAYRLLDFSDVIDFKADKLQQPFKYVHKADVGRGPATEAPATGEGSEYGKKVRNDARYRRRARLTADEVTIEHNDGTVYLGQEELAKAIQSSAKSSRFYLLQAETGDRFNMFPIEKWYKCVKPRNVHRSTEEEIEVRFAAKNSTRERLPFHVAPTEETQIVRMKVEGPTSMSAGGGGGGNGGDEEDGQEEGEGGETEKKRARKKNAYRPPDMDMGGGGDEDMEEVDIDNVFGGAGVMDSEDEMPDYGPSDGIREVAEAEEPRREVDESEEEDEKAKEEEVKKRPWESSSEEEEEEEEEEGDEGDDDFNPDDDSKEKADKSEGRAAAPAPAAPTQRAIAPPASAGSAAAAAANAPTPMAVDGAARKRPADGGEVPSKRARPSGVVSVQTYALHMFKPLTHCSKEEIRSRIVKVLSRKDTGQEELNSQFKKLFKKAANTKFEEKEIREYFTKVLGDMAVKKENEYDGTIFYHLKDEFRAK